MQALLVGVMFGSGLGLLVLGAYRLLTEGPETASDLAFGCAILGADLGPSRAQGELAQLERLWCRECGRPCLGSGPAAEVH